LHKKNVVILGMIVVCVITILLFVVRGMNVDVFSKKMEHNDGIPLAISSVGETSVGTNVKATFNGETGEVRIYSTSGIGTIDRWSLISFYDKCGKANIISITFQNKVYAPTNSSELFRDLTKLQVINNANNLNVSKVINMWAMFCNCGTLKNIVGLSDWDVSSVTTMQEMFVNCRSLASIEDLSNWNVSNVTRMSSMFNGCSSLTSINLSNWDMTNVTSVWGMFNGCEKIEEIYTPAKLPSGNLNIILPKRYKDANKPEERNKLYNSIQTGDNKFSKSVHLFDGIFVSFDLDIAEEYFLDEYTDNIKARAYSRNQLSKFGGMASTGEKLLPYNEDGKAILWDEDALRREKKYEFLGWECSYDHQYYDVPFVANYFPESVIYTAVFDDKNIIKYDLELSNIGKETDKLLTGAQYKIEGTGRKNVSQKEYMVSENGTLEIEGEVLGNEIDFDEAVVMCLENLSFGKTNIDFNLIANIPMVVSTDEMLNENVKAVNHILSTIINFELTDGTIITLDKQTMKDWVCVDEDGIYYVEGSNIRNFVEELNQKVQETKGSLVFTPSDYDGQVLIPVTTKTELSIDVEAEITQIRQELAEAGTHTRSPIYEKDIDVDNYPSYVEIDITRQKVWMYYEGECIVDGVDCVTGNAGNHDTPTGLYYLKSKSRNAVLRGRNDDGSRYASPVAFWMPFNGGIGMHDASWRHGVFGGEIYKGNGSHGCVNMNYEDAKTIYEHIEKGMPIIVYASDKDT